MAQAPAPNDATQAVDPVPGSVPPPVQPFEQFIPPVPTNQSTTKPRQTPGDGGGAPQPGSGADSTMNPAANGSDVPPDDSTTDLGGAGEAAQPKPPVQAKHSSYVLADIMTDIVEGNPGLGERQAFLLAKRVLDEYPVTKQADAMNPLSFGDRGRVGDGPITRSIGRPKPKPKAKPGERVPVPAESPSRHQDTVQPEHAPIVLQRDRPEIQEALQWPPPDPDSIPEGLQLVQDENQVWRHAASRKAVQR